MSWMQDFKTPSAFDPEKLIKLQMGVWSPLWMTFAGCATAGAALWSYSRWMSLAAPTGLAVLEAKPATAPVVTREAAPEPVADPIPAPVAEAVAEGLPAVAAPAPAPALKAAPKPKAAPAVAAGAPVKVKAAAPVVPLAKIDGRTKAARAAKAARLAEMNRAPKARKPRGSQTAH